LFSFQEFPFYTGPGLFNNFFFGKVALKELGLTFGATFQFSQYSGVEVSPQG